MHIGNELGRVIEARLEERGWPLARLVAVTGIEPDLVAELVGPSELVAMPDEDTLHILSEALDLRPGWLILDLTDCTALGAGALQLLNDAHRHAATCGGQLVLLHPTAELARTLAMSGLLAHVTVDLRTQPRAS